MQLAKNKKAAKMAGRRLGSLRHREAKWRQCRNGIGQIIGVKMANEAAIVATKSQSASAKKITGVMKA
jgi:hypothetical protein